MIRILTDSTSDITPAQAREMNIDLIPLNIHFDGIAYDQANDTDFSSFYHLLTTEKVFPTTSQPSPEAFASVFEAARDAGDEVIALLLSGRLSGTVQSAQIAKDTVGHSGVHIIDTETAIMPQRTLVEYAAKLRDAGEEATSIVSKVTALRSRVKVLGMLDTLTYLYKGGRLSRTAALAGNLLHIRPIVTIKDGVVTLCGRGRNTASMLKKFAEQAFDPDFPVYFGYTSDDTNCRKMMTTALEQFPIVHTGVTPVGGVIGAHVGPGAVAISYVLKEA